MQNPFEPPQALGPSGPGPTPGSTGLWVMAWVDLFTTLAGALVFLMVSSGGALLELSLTLSQLLYGLTSLGWAFATRLYARGPRSPAAAPWAQAASWLALALLPLFLGRGLLATLHDAPLGVLLGGLPLLLGLAFDVALFLAIAKSTPNFPGWAFFTYFGLRGLVFLPGLLHLFDEFFRSIGAAGSASFVFAALGTGSLLLSLLHQSVLLVAVRWLRRGSVS